MDSREDEQDLSDHLILAASLQENGNIPPRNCIGDGLNWVASVG